MLEQLSWPVKSCFQADVLCSVEKGCCPSSWIKQQWLQPNILQLKRELGTLFPRLASQPSQVCVLSVLWRERAPAHWSGGSSAFLADAVCLTGDTRTQYALPDGDLPFDCSWSITTLIANKNNFSIANIPCTWNKKHTQSPPEGKQK